ncbi:MAG TPA: multicopper oxidase family protein [Candidatus Binatia bacterium]|nr:multicopper oxidase family protein [Candidatus Binatia bacterium]
MKNTFSKTHLLLGLVLTIVLSVVPAAYAAAPGITGPTFNLTAQAAYISQPDGQAVYSWGYGCNGAPSGFAPAAITATFCNTMQVPGPTLIVNEGQTVTVKLTNGLPASAGNTSILFPGFTLTSTSGGVVGPLTQEAAPGGTVTYTFTASSPGTRAYYSGSQGDLQIEMGLYGAIIVLPASVPSACTSGIAASNLVAETHWGEADFRLSQAAYDHPKTCYDREYLFQFSEMDPNIHKQAETQVAAISSCVPSTTTTCPTSLNVATEPYHPSYFLINGRSMPDDMDPNYATQYPHQPYNGDPHMHPGEMVLIRVIGQGRWQHPFHEHGNHVRILARDGNLILTPDGAALAGPLQFTTTTTPGLAFDGIFYWTAKGLNWDAYGHNPASKDPSATLSCTPDANGYNTGAPTAINYYEWCQDHDKPLQVAPFGDVAGGGPTTLPDPNIFTNGPWFGGSPYLGPDATMRATGCMNSSSSQSNSPDCGNTGVTPPSGTIANPPSSEAGFAFMWHSHNEREITTNNIFPGGMLMMMLVDSREFVIDETN